MKNKKERNRAVIFLALQVADISDMLDRAECVVQPFLHGGARTARASLSQVKSAAIALSLRCAAGGQSQGGIVTNIGQSNIDCAP